MFNASYINALPYGTRLNNEYTIIEKIYQNNFYIFYKVKDDSDNIFVVKELFLAGSDREQRNIVPPSEFCDLEYALYVTFFLEENRMIMENYLPGIVRIKDVFEENNTSYIAMEHITDISLNEFMVKNYPLSVESINNLLKKILIILESLNNKDFFYNDTLNASNIFIGEDMDIRISGFGRIEKYLPMALTLKSSIAVDGYTPPEKLSRHYKDSVYSQIYSLGAIMYKIITGDDPAPAMDRILYNDDLFFKKSVNISKEYKILIRKCMEIDVKNRFNSFSEILKYLENIDEFKSLSTNDIKNKISKAKFDDVYYLRKIKVSCTFEEPRIMRNIDCANESYNKKNYGFAWLNYLSAICRYETEYYDRKNDGDNSKKLDEIYAVAGECAIKIHSFKEAFSNFDHAVKLKKDCPDYYNGRGLALMGLKDYESSIEDFNYAILFEKNEVCFYLNKAIALIKLNLLESAINVYSEVILLEPDNAGYYKNRAELYIKLKKYDDALDDYSSMIRLNPDHPWLYLKRAFLYDIAEKYNEAQDDLNKAISLNPHSSEYYFERGNFFNNIGEIEKSHEDFKKAIELESGAKNLIGSSSEENDILIKKLSKCIKLDPLNVEYYEKRANAYMLAEDYKNALNDYNRLIKLSPANSVYYVVRGNIYLNCFKNKENALEDFNLAIINDPDEVEYYIHRGDVLDILKQIEEAIDDFSRAIILKPEKSEYYYKRAQLYLKNDQGFLSEKDFLKYIDLETLKENPDFYTIERVRELLSK